MERQILSPFAAKAADSAGRSGPEEQDPVRTCFQRDRDRILHCKPFRRLKHKTQVFIEPFGDHFRTRLTHSMEVAQISRTIARALSLNEDLAEAIALGHDVGHTPFGHAGEEALDSALRSTCPSCDGFKHYEQSLRVLEVLEKLNLSEEVKEGISGHSKGRKDLSSVDGEPVSTLEAAVVRVSDRIAYVNHDLDDALRSGLIDSAPAFFLDVAPTHSKRIGAMVLDVITNSVGQPFIRLSPAMMAKIDEMKEWLFENVYLHYPVVYPDSRKAVSLLKELFFYYCEPGNLPSGFEGVQGAVDYVAGMTDRFAIETYADLKLPRGFRSQ